MSFNDLVQAADSIVITTVGEPVLVTRDADGAQFPGVMMVIDEGVPVLLGEAQTVGTTIAYREAEAGVLVEKDRVTTAEGKVFELSRRIDGDGDWVTRLAVEQ